MKREDEVLIEQVASDRVTCPNGHLNAPGQSFCGTCGSPLGAIGGVERATSPSVTPLPAVPTSTGSAPQPQQSGSLTKKVKPVGPILGLVGGGLVLLGSFMPWASIASGFGSVGIAGTEGDGKITLFLGVVLVVFGVISLTSGRRLALLQVLASLGAGVIAVIDLVNAFSRVASVNNGFVHASVGAGLYLVLAGAIASAVGGFAS